MLTLRCNKCISDTPINEKYSKFAIDESIEPIEAYVHECTADLPTKVSNIDDSKGILPPNILNELSQMLFKRPEVRLQQFKVCSSVHESDYGKQIIHVMPTLNMYESVNFIDTMTKKFDIVLLCCPFFEDIFSERCYMVTIMNPDVNIGEVLTNENDMLLLYHNQLTRSNILHQKAESLSKFVEKYVRFLSTVNGYTKTD